MCSLPEHTTWPTAPCGVIPRVRIKVKTARQGILVNGSFVFYTEQGKSSSPLHCTSGMHMHTRIVCPHPSYCFGIQPLTIVQVCDPSQGFNCQQKMHELVTLWDREVCGRLDCSLPKNPGNQILIWRDFQEKSNEDWKVLLNSKKKSCSLPSKDTFLPLRTLLSLSLSSL